MKYTKEDKKFLIQFSLMKKNELINQANMTATLILISLTVLFAMYALILTTGADPIWKATFIIILPCLLYPLWKDGTKKYCEYLREAKNFQKQYREYFNDTYPGLEKKGFHIG